MIADLNSRPPFPKIWDNTMTSDGADCTMKMNYRFFHHLRSNVRNIDLHAGGAYAKGMEVARIAWYTPGRELPSPDAPLLYGARALIKEYGDVDPGDNVKSPDRMLGALESYFQQWNPATDHIKPAIIGGQPCVEFNFSFPIDVQHPETGEPLIYTGRFDSLMHLNGDESCVYVYDDKTTKQLGGSWAKQWGLRSQFMGYVWGAKKYGHNVKGAIIRGTSILKTKYGHAEAIAYFPDWMIDRWYEQLISRIERWKRMWAGVEKWEYNFSSICTQYSGCQYRLLCESETPNDWLEPNYRVEPWEPAKVRKSDED